MQFRKYTKEQFILAISNSLSIAAALRLLGVAPHGGNYRTARNYIENLKLDTSHMSGQSWNKGKTFGPKRPIEDYLSNKHYIQSNRLKHRLIREGYFSHKCYGCGLSKWKCFITNETKPVPLELDHIDGDYKNNNLSNLRILCHNCHTMTPTYRGKNRDKIKIKQVKPNKIFRCSKCYTSILEKSKLCKQCFNTNRKTKIDWPPTNELITQVSETSFTFVAKTLGVSDNAIRKRIKKYPML